MYVYLVEFYVVNSHDVRFGRDTEIYGSWDQACKAVDKFKNENIEHGCLVCYDATRENNDRQVKLKDNDDIRYRAEITKFEVK